MHGVSMFVLSKPYVVQFHANNYIQLTAREETQAMKSIVEHTRCQREEGNHGNETVMYEPRTKNHKHHPNLAKILEKRVDKTSQNQRSMKRGPMSEEGENMSFNYN